jgi:hypothetical protein
MAEECEEAVAADHDAGPSLPPAEVIDLTCVPLTRPGDDRHTAEPPLAEGDAVRPVHFERPAVSEDGSQPPPMPLTMPYLTDDAEPPAKLPMLIESGEEADEPPHACGHKPCGPVWEAVRSYFENAARLPSGDDRPCGMHQSFGHPAGVTGHPCDACPNLGKPPVGEHVTTPEVGGGCPCCPDKPKDTPKASAADVLKKWFDESAGNECPQRNVTALPDWFVGPPPPPGLHRCDKPSVEEQEAPRPKKSKVDTMECRPGEGARRPAGRPF